MTWLSRIMTKIQPYRALFLVIFSTAVVGVLYVIEQLLGATYIEKTALKIVLFTVLPLILLVGVYRDQARRILGLSTLTLKSLIPGLVLGSIAFGVVLISYLILGPFIDTAGIVSSLETKLGISAATFVYVALFVVCINSLLEEFFFRGFVFLNLHARTPAWFAYGFSAFLFAIYHVAIIQSWFNPVLTALALTTLFVTGLVLNYLNVRSGHFLNSWMAHAFADAAIVLIGFHLFGFF